jgi:hypothetical protein
VARSSGAVDAAAFAGEGRQSYCNGALARRARYLDPGPELVEISQPAAILLASAACRS